MSLEESLLALDTLFDVLLPTRDINTSANLIGSHLLLSEENFPNRKEKMEKLAYFHDSIHSASDNHQMRDYWKRLRKLNLFKPTYAKYGLNSLSTVQRNVLGGWLLFQAVKLDVLQNPQVQLHLPLLEQQKPCLLTKHPNTLNFFSNPLYRQPTPI